MGALPAVIAFTLFVIVTEIAAGPVIVNPSESDLVESFTDVAVIVGALFGGAGMPLGGVYVTLVVVAPLNLPHTRKKQAEPFTVNVHAAPELVVSFCTCAVNVSAADPAGIAGNLLVMVTEIAAGPVIVNPSASDFVVSFTDVAVIVGALVGAVAGGV
jgi:hypothetical protein